MDGHVRAKQNNVQDRYDNQNRSPEGSASPLALRGRIAPGAGRFSSMPARLEYEIAYPWDLQLERHRFDRRIVIGKKRGGAVSGRSASRSSTICCKRSLVTYDSDRWPLARAAHCSRRNALLVAGCHQNDVPGIAVAVGILMIHVEDVSVRKDGVDGAIHRVEDRQPTAPLSRY